MAAVASRKKGAPGAGGGGPEKDVLLANLEQMKVLADPRRIRILELLGEERTTKQVADILGEPPTRLYHHVAALARVGLIRLARTRQSRGAQEKYYVAVAKAFSADPRLFTSRRGPQAAEVARSIATQALDLTAEDLRALLLEGDHAKTVTEQGILSYLEVRGTAKEVAALRAKLQNLIESCTAPSKKPGEKAPPYRLTIAFFPLPQRK
jgi:DNA-binding transcriptional ArsR family regulator